MRRIPAVVAAVTGIVLIVGIFAMSSFSRASAGEDLIVDARPSVDKNGIVRFRSDLDTLKAGADDVVQRVFPAFAAELGMTEAEFEAKVRSDHPALVHAFINEGAAILDAIEAGVSNLEAHQSDFEAADDIPVPGSPITVMPWFGLLLGLGLIALGAWAWRRPGRKPAAAIAAVGLAMVALTLVTGLPDKTQKAERLIDSLNITDEVAATTRQQFDTATMGAAELQPFLAEFADALDETPDQFAATLDSDFPGLANVLGDTQLFDRIEGEVEYREDHVEEFADVKDAPIEMAAWAFVALGLVVALSTIPMWRRPTALAPAAPRVLNTQEPEARAEDTGVPPSPAARLDDGSP